MGILGGRELFRRQAWHGRHASIHQVQQPELPRQDDKTPEQASDHGRILAQADGLSPPIIALAPGGGKIGR